MLAGLQGRGLVHLGQRMGAGSYVQTGKLTQTGIAHVGERRKAPRVCQDEQLLEFRIPAPTSRAGFCKECSFYSYPIEEKKTAILKLE